MMNKEQTGIYACSNKRCSDRGQELQAAPPQVIRQATGGPATCPRCGQVLHLRRIVIKDS